MPFCASCGSQVEGKFCPKCGAAIVAGGAAPPPSSGPVSSPYVAPVAAAPLQDNVASALCYALGFITGIVFLVMEPYSKNRAIRFHAFQSIFMSVALFGIEIVLGFILTMLPWSMYYFLWRIFGLALFALWAFLIYSAYQGKTIVLPVVGPLAQKQAQS